MIRVALEGSSDQREGIAVARIQLNRYSESMEEEEIVHSYEVGRDGSCSEESFNLEHVQTIIQTAVYQRLSRQPRVSELDCPGIVSLVHIVPLTHSSSSPGACLDVVSSFLSILRCS